ncbi:MAG: ferrochelatase [Porphyromonas sp.]|nr:ferrochelatase [Porphyromonas sp.]
MSDRRAILLINTGSPTSLEVKAVRRYLADFLTDKRVISLPKWIRIPLVKGIIAPFRAASSRDKYALIWEEDGAPLLLRTRELARKIERESGIPVYVAMRYNKGSMAEALEQITLDGRADEVVAVPLFPHYAMSSYESALDHALSVYRKGEYPFRLKCVAPYYNHPLYIEAVAERVEQTVTQERLEGKQLIFSYHGIPISQTKPYRGNKDKDYESQCIEATRLVMNHPRVKALGLSEEIAYQSKFGTNKWLSPTLEQRLSALPKEGKNRVAVVCPSFVCDCLETSWEIGIDLKDKFEGERLTLVPCPNDSTPMARAIINQVMESTDDIEMWTQP